MRRSGCVDVRPSERLDDVESVAVGAPRLRRVDATTGAPATVADSHGAHGGSGREVRAGEDGAGAFLFRTGPEKGLLHPESAEMNHVVCLYFYRTSIKHTTPPRSPFLGTVWRKARFARELALVS